MTSNSPDWTRMVLVAASHHSKLSRGKSILTSIVFPAGKTIDVKIDLPRDSFEWWDAATNTMRVQSGEFEVMVGNSSRPEDLKTITVKI